MKNTSITKSTVDRLAPGDVLHDREIAGFIARCLPSGVVSYGFRYRTADGKRPMLSLGVHGKITPAEARTLAKKRAGEVADGRDPAGARDAAREKVEINKTKTVDAVLDEHVRRHVENLGSAATIKSAFDRSVRPAIGTRLIYDLCRGDIVDMLDDIEDDNGPVQADRTLAYLRKAFNWQMARDDAFRSPIIRGMNRTNPSERRRRRILTDEEIRDVWHAATRAAGRAEEPSAPECFPQFIHLLFLTAQRRTQVAAWHADQIDGDHWLVDGADYKNDETQLIPITAAIRAELCRHKGFLVSSDGGASAFAGFSKAKDAIDAEIATERKARGAKPMPHWVFHDIRRTGRSLMSRYTTPDHAERVIGHVIPGVRGVYDHYDYLDEKRLALEKLAAHILGVVHPDSGKIVPLRFTRAEVTAAAQ